MTEREHPYRAAPALVSLIPRVATVVGVGQDMHGGDVVHRVVEALAVGEGHIVTVTDLRAPSFVDPQGPGLGRFHLASLAVAPQLHRERTTFYTMATLDQIRSGFFENADVVPSRRATIPALPVDDTGAAEERDRLEQAVMLLLQLRRLVADVWDGGLEDDAGTWPRLREQIDEWMRAEAERSKSVFTEVVSIPPTAKDGG